MTQNVKMYEICKKYAENNKGKQELEQHKIGGTPWIKLNGDLCDIYVRLLLVVTYYYSSLISVAKLKSTTTPETNIQLQHIFAIHGIPQKVVTAHNSEQTIRSLQRVKILKSYNKVRITQRVTKKWKMQ